jgi:hypothetical protein
MIVFSTLIINKTLWLIFTVTNALAYSSRVRVGPGRFCSNVPDKKFGKKIQKKLVKKTFLSLLFVARDCKFSAGWASRQKMAQCSLAECHLAKCHLA